MNNLKLLAMGNRRDFHKYIFERNKGFKDEFLELLKKLGFEDKNINNFWIRSVPIGDDDDIDDGIPINPTIDYFEDSFFRMENDDCELELFIGNKKIFLIIRKNGDMKKIIDHLLNSDWRNKEELDKAIEEKSNKLKKQIPENKRYLLEVKK